MRAVVDASAAVTLMLDPGRRGFASQLTGYDSLHAPSHFDVECSSAFRKAMLRGILTDEQFTRLVLALPPLPIRRHSTSALLPRMIDLSRNASMYDAAYIALAEGLSADLITSDARLQTVPGVQCRVLHAGSPAT